MSKRHFFILPTLGENYGHVIIEGAVAGCPLIISDRTQWVRLLQKGAGWDIPLDDLSQWKSVVQGCIDMTDETYRRMSQGAKEFGRAVMNNRENLNANIGLFQRATNSAVKQDLRMSGAAR
jgi:glycosyltransferase involved in cell wall biosynthesis